MGKRRKGGEGTEKGEENGDKERQKRGKVYG